MGTIYWSLKGSSQMNKVLFSFAYSVTLFQFYRFSVIFTLFFKFGNIIKKVLKISSINCTIDIYYEIFGLDRTKLKNINKQNMLKSFLIELSNYNIYLLKTFQSFYGSLILQFNVKKLS